MDVVNLKGVGPKKVEQLNDIGIYTIEDLFYYYPTSVKYKDYTAVDEEYILVRVRVVSVEGVRYIRGNLNYFKFKGIVDNTLVSFTVFNQGYLRQYIIVDNEVVVEAKRGKSDYNVLKVYVNKSVPFVEVRYKQTKGLKSSYIAKLVQNALYEYHDIIKEEVPDSLIEKYKLFSIKEAMYLIHNPKSEVDFKNALRTLKYNEAYSFMYSLEKNKNEELKCDFTALNTDISPFLEKMEYQLTIGQKSVINDVFKDIDGNRCISRLVHGDVGSGKTLISIILSYVFINSGSQVAILCPTEVLAKQMYAQYSKYLDSGVLLTNSVKKSEAKQHAEKIKSGEIKFVVGTHSILNDNIEFMNLEFAVIDEQHRFGVFQRETLINKMKNKNILYMSATPIPRTVGLVLHDNLKMSKVEGKPKNRKETVTKYYESLNEEVIMHIKNQVQSGFNCFVIAPAISENVLNLENVESVEKQYKKVFPKMKISSIHGKMDKEEQNKNIELFRTRKIDILISTTIVEVGVDIPCATTIIIHQASRFGLAQLHQLRGRVGRNSHASYCFIVNDNLSERLEFFINCSDGFEISEADYKLRGPGNLIGVEQSGYNLFKTLDIFEDVNILTTAKNDVKEYLKPTKKMTNF